MSKRKKRKPDRLPGSRRRSSTPSSGLAQTSYDISWEPVLDTPDNKLAPDLQRELERLYNLIHTHPATVIDELEKWIEKYPDAAKLYNFLSNAYLGVNDKVNSERIIRENYRRHPDYLFAKINYAQLCLEKGELDEIPLIFNNKYDLSLLHPERRVFHITEWTSFMWIIGSYFCLKGETERAEFYHRALLKVEPDDPATKDLGRKLQFLGMMDRVKGVLGKLVGPRRK
jgi:hypothetical protein